jgi:hypothetical protein
LWWSVLLLLLLLLLLHLLLLLLLLPHEAFDSFDWPPIERVVRVEKSSSAQMAASMESLDTSVAGVFHF